MGSVRISARVDYAVRAAVELAAAAPGALTCDRIAAAQGIPSRLLQSIPGGPQRGRRGARPRPRSDVPAAAPRPLTSARIAAAQGIPSRFLQSILGDLQHARLVTSQRGRDGGYRLALPPEQVSIARVMRIEQGFLA